MKPYLKIISIIFILSIGFESYGQDEIIAVSDDGQYIAVLQKTTQIKDTIFIKDTNSYFMNSLSIYSATIEIYEPATGKHIQNINLKTKKKNKVTNAYFSKNKYTFCVNDGGTYHLWNIPSGKSIKTIEADTVVLSNIANSFYAQKDNKITKFSYFYNSNTTFSISTSSKITKIGLTSDDKFLIAKTENKIYVWDVRTSITKAKIYFGDDFSTDNSGNFYISKFKKGIVNITRFNAPSNQIAHERDRVISSKRYIKPGKILKRKVNKNQSQFSPDGKFYTYTSKKLFSKTITTVNLETGFKVFETKKKYKRYKKTQPYFYSDSICFLQKNSKTISVFNLNKKRVVEEVESNNKISQNQIYYNEKGVAIIENKTNVLVIEDKDNSKVIDDYKSSPKINTDGSHYFIKNKKNELVYYPIKDIMKDSSEMQLDEPTNKKHKIKKEFSDFKLDTLSYVSIDDLVHISKAKDTSIQLLVKSVQINEDYTGLQFYVLDDENNYYYGISDEEWKKSICGITIENEYGETMDIDDFEITEYSEKQKTPVAMCFVLDHSGSMGETNAKLMQTGLINLASEVKNNEGVAIVKFSDDVENTVELTNKKSKIAEKFTVVGLEGFGQGTALLDGINDGLDVLIKDHKYQNKALIVLTDGYENSSSTTQNEVLLKAMKNEIGIYTIGFGSSIDVEFLRSISTNTNGGYYWINDNNQFDEVFADVYKNMKNYYTLRFNTPYPGNYKITIDLCLDDIHKSVDYYFNNYVPDLLFTDNLIEYDSLFYDITGIGDTITIDDFNSNKIYEGIEYFKFKEEFDSIIFPNIKFYFDETRIVEGTDKELINVINFMKKYPYLRIEIQGHTDNKGGYLYNEKLSQARAEKVRQMMINQGIDAQRVRTIGYGETKPIATNQTDEGRQENRRVEFLLVK